MCHLAVELLLMYDLMVALFGCTGRVETSRCQRLSGGKAGHDPSGLRLAVPVGKTGYGGYAACVPNGPKRKHRTNSTWAKAITVRLILMLVSVAQRTNHGRLSASSRTLAACMDNQANLGSASCHMIGIQQIQGRRAL